MEFAEDLAGYYIKCFLARQGWKLECIKKLICKSFDNTAADNANKAKWDKKRNKVISGASMKHADHNKRLDTSLLIALLVKPHGKSRLRRRMVQKSLQFKHRCPNWDRDVLVFLDLAMTDWRKPLARGSQPQHTCLMSNRSSRLKLMQLLIGEPPERRMKRTMQ